MMQNKVGACVENDNFYDRVGVYFAICSCRLHYCGVNSVDLPTKMPAFFLNLVIIKQVLCIFA